MLHALDMHIRKSRETKEVENEKERALIKKNSQYLAENILTTFSLLFIKIKVCLIHRVTFSQSTSTISKWNAKLQINLTKTASNDFPLCSTINPPSWLTIANPMLFNIYPNKVNFPAYKARQCIRISFLSHWRPIWSINKNICKIPTSLTESCGGNDTENTKLENWYSEELILWHTWKT